jgi:hypothetical protein
MVEETNLAGRHDIRMSVNGLGFLGRTPHRGLGAEGGS